MEVVWFSVALRPQRRVGLLGTGGGRGDYIPIATLSPPE